MKSKIYFSLFVALLLANSLFAQQKNILGRILDSATHIPINGATIFLNPGKQTEATDDNGRFFFKNIPATVKTMIVSAIGYKKQSFSLADFKYGQIINLTQQQTQLADVVISGNATNPYQTISESDIKMRNISNSQEVLRMVPGLFIGQHQGGGKAEQIFLRGFDNDHGTDISLNVDDMPINMVSHAHGQGYADSHFIIPETIESTTYKKGPYDAEKGDLATTGFVDFHTADAISNNTVRIEGGQFDTYRILGMFNLLNDKAKAKNQSWYAASEYRYSTGY